LGPHRSHQFTALRDPIKRPATIVRASVFAPDRIFAGGPICSSRSPF
jgi:hypothetical protein